MPFCRMSLLIQSRPSASAPNARVLPTAAMKKLIKHPAFMAAVGRLLGWYLIFALRTTRWTLVGAENLQPLAVGTPVVVAFWHEFLTTLPAIRQVMRPLPSYRYTPISSMVSGHRDGRLIGDILAMFDIGSVHGSSSKGGAAGALGLLRLLRAGTIVSIVPDGPRGPRRQADPGVAQLAALGHCPIVPIACLPHWHRRLGTWDRMVVPLPFGRGYMVAGEHIWVPRDNWRDAMPEIEAAMNRVSDEAEPLCRA